MLAPNKRLNGVAVKVASGMVHFLALKITEFDPSQSASYVRNVPTEVFNVTKKLVKGEPLASGAFQVTITVLFLITVTGASSFSGLNALKIVITFDG